MTNIIDQVKACQEAASRAQAARARATHELEVAEAARQAVAEQLQAEFSIGIDGADSLLSTLETRLNTELAVVRDQLAGAQGG